MTLTARRKMAQRLLEDPADSAARVERAVGVLEDVLHCAALPIGALCCAPAECLAIEHDSAVVLAVQSRDGARERGLAGS